MATIADELNAISVEHGYTGAAPKTIADAIDALADTLAGEDVTGSRSIAGAIHALAPYIGSGGGTELGPISFVGAISGSDNTTMRVSTTPYDITSIDTTTTNTMDVDDSIYDNTNVLDTTNSNGVNARVPSGCYVIIKTTVPVDWTTDSLSVYGENGEQQITSGFECRVTGNVGTSNYPYAYAYFTMQIPAAPGVAVDFGSGEGGD